MNLNSQVLSIPAPAPTPKELQKALVHFLEQNKAQDVSTISLAGKSSFADYMIVASGTSGRFLKALSEKIKGFLHQNGVGRIRIEGAQECEWILVDGGDIIIHLFRPDARLEYNLEAMWSPMS